MELSTIRCSQVSFKAGPGCGSCTFDLPVSKTDTQALGKRRSHTCACSAAGGPSLCPVETARDLHAAARSFAPAANPDPGMRPLWPTRRGQFPSKSETGWVERSRCQNHRARLSGHGSPSNGCGRHRVVAHPGLLSMGLPGGAGVCT